MSALSAKLRSVGFGTAGSGIAFWCPGCNEAHAIRTEGTGGEFNRARWSFDGNVDAPTLSPSILVRANFSPEDGDCTHALRGQAVPLPDWPAHDHDLK